MAGPASKLAQAALQGDEEAVAAWLAAGADPNTLLASGLSTSQLVASETPVLMMAAEGGSARCVSRLLATGADPLRSNPDGRTALYTAALVSRDAPAAPNRLPLMRLLLAAAPEAVLARDKWGYTPLQLALGCVSYLRLHLEGARFLLEAAPLPPLGDIFIAMYRAGIQAQPLYALLVSRQPLYEFHWNRLPIPCADLGAALPAVLERSALEAGFLVRHLNVVERRCLRTAALCLQCPQRHFGRCLPRLPGPLVGHILAFSATGPE